MATAELSLRLATQTCDVDVSKGVRFRFDAATPEEMVFEGRLPANYASGLTAKIQYSMVSATSGTVEFEVSVMAVTPGDAAAVGTDSYDTSNDVSEEVPGTEDYLSELSVALANADSAAAGDYLRIRVARDADDGTNDTATGDAMLRNFVIEFTTS